MALSSCDADSSKTLDNLPLFLGSKFKERQSGGLVTVPQISYLELWPRLIQSAVTWVHGVLCVVKMRQPMLK